MADKREGGKVMLCMTEGFQPKLSEKKKEKKEKNSVPFIA